MFRIISDPGSQQQVTLSLQSISTIPFHAGVSHVKMPKLRQHSPNRRMPCFVDVFGTFQGTCDKAYQNPGAVCRCMADIFSNNTYREIERVGMLIARNVSQVSLVKCTTDRHNRRSGRKLIIGIAPRITRLHLAVYAMALRLSEAHRFDIDVRLKRKMC